MASLIQFFNERGEEVVGRYYRFDVPRSAIERFRSHVIGSKSTGTIAPVQLIDNTNFVTKRHRNLFVVAAFRSNCNIFTILEFLTQKLKILKSYLGKKFDEDALRGNFTLVYELFDETMDFGYAQNCAIDILRLYINLGNTSLFTAAPTQATGSQLTAQITGAIDWRREGIRYRNNKIWIDVHETVNMLTSATGTVLRAEITGKVMMKTQLTGMPECKFGLNDRLSMEKDNDSDAKKDSVDIDNCSFHRCVRLGKFDSERAITFIPPDGEFELMSYRIAEAKQPFKLIPTFKTDGSNRMMVHLRVKAMFQDDKKATNIVIKIPVPPNAATAKCAVTKGRAKYEPGARALIWRISTLPGQYEVSMTSEVFTLEVTKGREKKFDKPPISMDFNIPMYSCSGVAVRFLKVYEKSNYETYKWVRFFSKAGDYAVRY